MHDIKLIRKNPDFFSKKIAERNSNIDIKRILDLDKKNRELIQKKENLEQEKKIITKKKDESKFSRSKDISKEIQKLLSDKNYIDQILGDGAAKAQDISSKKVKKIKEIVGF